MLEQGVRTLVAPVEDVSYLSAETGGAMIFLKDDMHGYVGESLTQLFAELDPAKFARATRQFVVALDAIKAFDAIPARRICNLVLRDPYADLQIQIPNARKKELMELLY